MLHIRNRCLCTLLNRTFKFHLLLNVNRIPSRISVYALNQPLLSTTPNHDVDPPFCFSQYRAYFDFYSNNYLMSSPNTYNTLYSSVKLLKFHSGTSNLNESK